VTEHRFAGVDHYQLEVEHFSDCVRVGTPLALPLADSLARAATTEAIYRAAGYTWPRE
jgi:hypothetical protein